jgi:hypothetical protein
VSCAPVQLTVDKDRAVADTLADTCGALLATCARKSTGADAVLAALVDAWVAWADARDISRVRLAVVTALSLLENAVRDS